MNRITFTKNQKALDASSHMCNAMSNVTSGAFCFVVL